MVDVLIPCVFLRQWWGCWWYKSVNLYFCYQIDSTILTFNVTQTKYIVWNLLEENLLSFIEYLFWCDILNCRMYGQVLTFSCYRVNEWLIIQDVLKGWLTWHLDNFKHSNLVITVITACGCFNLVVFVVYCIYVFRSSLRSWFHN